MAVIIVCATAVQANTPLIHTIQADTDDTHNTVIYIQYRHIHAMANQRKTIFLTWWPEHLAVFPSQEILLAHLEQNTYQRIHTHTDNTSTYIHILTLLYVTCI